MSNPVARRTGGSELDCVGGETPCACIERTVRNDVAWVQSALSFKRYELKRSSRPRHCGQWRF